MKEYKIRETVRLIVTQTNNEDSTAAKELEKELMQEQILTQYYFIKALKEVCDNEQNDVYYEWALLTTKNIYRNILDNLYNFNEIEELKEVQSKGLNGIQKYIDIISDELKDAVKVEQPQNKI